MPLRGYLTPQRTAPNAVLGRSCTARPPPSARSPARSPTSRSPAARSPPPCTRQPLAPATVCATAASPSRPAASPRPIGRVGRGRATPPAAAAGTGDTALGDPIGIRSCTPRHERAPGPCAPCRKPSSAGCSRELQRTLGNPAGEIRDALAQVRTRVLSNPFPAHLRRRVSEGCHAPSRCPARPLRRRSGDRHDSGRASPRTLHRQPRAEEIGACGTGLVTTRAATLSTMIRRLRQAPDGAPWAVSEPSWSSHFVSIPMVECSTVLRARHRLWALGQPTCTASPSGTRLCLLRRDRLNGGLGGLRRPLCPDGAAARTEASRRHRSQPRAHRPPPPTPPPPTGHKPDTL